MPKSMGVEPHLGRKEFVGGSGSFRLLGVGRVGWGAVELGTGGSSGSLKQPEGIVAGGMGG